MSLPLPEPGIRLIRQDSIAMFDRHITEFQAQLNDAVSELDRHDGELRSLARERLGALFNVSDDPTTMNGMFAIEHDDPASNGQWTVVLSPVSGPTLGPFPKRSEALDGKLTWRQTNWLTSTVPSPRTS